MLVSVKNCRFGEPFWGICSTLGKARGTRIMLITGVLSALAGTSSTIKCNALPATSGKGCARSRAIGSSSGFTLASKYFFTQIFCFSVCAVSASKSMPACFNAGISSLLNTLYLRLTNACAWLDTSSKVSAVTKPFLTPSRMASSCASMRTSKNSSMLESTIHKNFKRSSKG